MPICFSCKVAFETESSLLSHISISHSFLSTFRCPEKECQRSWSLFNSYQKHRRSVHVESSNNTFEINEMEVDVEDHHEIPNQLPRENFIPSNTASPSADPNLGHYNSDSTPVYNDQSTVSPTIVLLSKLHSYPEIPRKKINSIIADFNHFLQQHIKSLKQAVMNEVKKGSSVDMISAQFLSYEDPFSNLESEYLQMKKFSELGTYIPPIQYDLGLRDEFKEVNGVQTLTHVKSTAEFISIRSVLKKFFEQPGVFLETMNYYESLISDESVLQNFVQGALWRSKIEKVQNKLILPLFLYFDDFENNNPLGSHAGVQKCGGVYVTIPCLPSSFSSKLSTIFLFVLFNSLDHKQFKNERIFTKVVDELKFLEKTGVSIKYHSCMPETQLHFSLSLIQGDNLGLHSILGFVESFRSNYPCRFCVLKSSEFQTNFVENIDYLRTPTNYEEHLVINDVSKTGIKERCVFHNLPSFHFTKNVSVDSMHDLFEGVCQYDLAKLLHHLIFVEEVFTLDQLNNRIKGFQYNKWDNKVPEIIESQLKSSLKLKMSCSEMISFVKNLGLIIGDLLLPVECPHWELYILLKQIADIVLSMASSVGSVDILQDLIEEYLITLQSVFPNSIKPKHHLLIHYPRMMRSFGPLWKSSSIRFESKHRPCKITSRAAICRINVCHTIAIKNQLILSYRFLTNDFSKEVWQAGPSDNSFLNKIIDLNLSSKYVNFDWNSTKGIKWVRFYDKKIVPGVIVVTPDRNGEPEFFRIEFILINTGGISFVMLKIDDAYYDEDFQGYKVFFVGDNVGKNYVIKSEKYVQDKCSITSAHLVGDGCTYIAKNWA